MGNTESKIKRLANNVKKDPDDSFSKFALALEFIKQDQWNKARILFESVRDNDPGYVGVYYHLGKLYEQLERPEDAAETYRKGIQVADNQDEERTVTELQEALEEVKFQLE